MKRETLQNIISWLMDHITKTTYYGVENLPAKGPLIVATNHLSHLDIPVLLCNPRRRDITALVTTKYQKSFPLNWILKTEEVIWLDREIADFGAVRLASEALKGGIALGISPEGTRSKTGGLIPAKSGTVLIALKSEAPIVPVGVWGTETGFKRLCTLRKPVMFARFGQAFHIPKFDRSKHAEELKHWTDEIMCRIAVLLPESYRGSIGTIPAPSNS